MCTKRAKAHLKTVCSWTRINRKDKSKTLLYARAIPSGISGVIKKQTRMYLNRM